MIRTAARLTLIALVIGAAGAGAQQRFTMEQGRGGMLAPLANPSDIVSAELAFATLSRQQGQWTGFRKTADKDAVLFVPAAVNAQTWLKKRADPPKSVTWAPDRVFMSCDSSYGIAHGHAEYPDGRKSGYVTIWRRQKDGSYKWVLDWSTDWPSQIAEDGIDGKVADCPPRRGRGPNAGAAEPPRGDDARRMAQPPKFAVDRIADPPPAAGSGQSVDGSLRWQWDVKPDGARTLKVTARYGGKDVDFIDDSRPAG